MDLTERQTRSQSHIPIEPGGFLVRGESTIYEGTHFLGKFGGFLPSKGGHGRLSEQQCRDLFRRFNTREEAQAWVEQNNAVEGRVFLASVEEAIPEFVGTPAQSFGSGDPYPSREELQVLVEAEAKIEDVLKALPVRRALAKELGHARNLLRGAQLAIGRAKRPSPETE